MHYLYLPPSRHKHVQACKVGLIIIIIIIIIIVIVTTSIDQVFLSKYVI